MASLKRIHFSLDHQANQQQSDHLAGREGKSSWIRSAGGGDVALFRPSQHCRPTSAPARFSSPILPYGRHFVAVIQVKTAMAP